MSETKRKAAAKKVRAAEEKFNEAIRECLDLEMRLTFDVYQGDKWTIYNRNAADDKDHNWSDITKITYQPPTPPTKEY